MEKIENLKKILKEVIRQAVEGMSKDQITEAILEIEDQNAKLIATIATLISTKGEN